MERFAIKHKPTGKFLHEDEGGTWLIEESDSFITFGDKKQADEIFSYYCENDVIETENGDFNINEFEVTKL
jgi:hypothetical protein